MLKDYIEDKLEIILNDFIEKYQFMGQEETKDLNIKLKNDFETLLNYTVQSNRDGILESCANIAKDNLQYRMPYTILINQISYIRNAISDILISNQAKDEIFELLSLYSNIENIIAREYLQKYLDDILRTNGYRINSLNDMVEKQFVIYYQHHLEWLSQLATSIKKLDNNLTPELNSNLCEFGGWLNTGAKEIIKNNSKYDEIKFQHSCLHDLGSIISKQLSREVKDFNVLMSYLEKCEMISLTIGTELALIDNTYLIKKAAKDEMTGALNRNSLQHLFVSQYELSLATDTKFVLAMCDLDHFKKINDTYGHIAGDNMLKAFVQTAHKNLRDSDVIVRYGGEEFVIFLPNSNIQNAEKKLNILREAFQNYVCKFDVHNISTTVSMGLIEIIPDVEVDASSLKVEPFIAEADKKLYLSKSSGRNRITS